MKVLVTGASGFVGGHLCRSLVSQGHRVTAVVRRSGGAPAGTHERVVPGISGETEWADILQGHDAVVHLAARVHVMDDDSDEPLEEFRRVNTAGTKQLADAAASAGVLRFIFLSSIKVNGESTAGVPFDVDSPPAPVDPYGISKYEAELALRTIEDTRGLAVVVIRTPLVYGPGVRGNFLRMLKVARSGLPLPLGAIRNARTLSSIWNLVDLIERSLEEPDVGHSLVLAGDPSSISTPEMFKVLTQAMSKRSILLKIPTNMLLLAGRVFRKEPEIERLTGSLEVSGGSGSETWGWSPPIGVEEGLSMTAEWFNGLSSFERGGSK